MDLSLSSFNNWLPSLTQKPIQKKRVSSLRYLFSLFVGRDPLRKIPEKSPTYTSSSWKPEDLHRLSEDARDNLYQNLNRLRSRRPSKEIPSTPNNMRPASTDDEIEQRKQPQRPGLRRRPFSVAVGVADLLKETGELDSRNAPVSNVSLPVDANTEEYNLRKISAQFGKRGGHEKLSPTKTKYVAISSLAAEGRGEVSLEAGEEVEVLQKESSGWWYVKTDHYEGWAPASFLEAAAPSRSNSPVAPRELVNSEHRESSCKIEDQLDICPDKPAELKNRKDYEKNNSKEPIENQKVLHYSRRTTTKTTTKQHYSFKLFLSVTRSVYFLLGRI